MTSQSEPTTVPTVHGEGYWLAADGRWYPPDQHPDAAPQAPSIPPPVPQALEKVSSGNGCAIAALVGAAVLFVVVAVLIVVGLYAAGGSQPSTMPDAATTTQPDEAVATTRPESPATTVAEVEPQVQVPTGMVSEAAGTREEPIPAGEVAVVDAVWSVQVLGVDRDAWPEIVAENEFNDPPDDGVRFVMATIAATLLSGEEPELPFLSLRTTMVGDAGIEHGESCGVLPDPLVELREVFAGGTVVGNVCVAVPEEDVERALLGVSSDFFGQPTFFTLDETDASVATGGVENGPVPGARHEAQRVQPIAVGQETDLGDGWTLEVVAAGVRTDDVLAENQFNDPPPAGHEYVVVDLIARYGNEAASSSLFEFVIGAVGNGNVAYDDFCGTIPGDADVFADVYAGATLATAVCFVVPEAELGSEVLFATVGFDDEPAFFAIR